MNKKGIFVNQEEEIISIVDRILQERGKEVVLFLPRGAQIFQSNVNLKLLKRESDNAGRQVIIVTEDESGQRMAEKNGFAVFPSKDDFDYQTQDGLTQGQEELAEEAAIQAERSLATAEQTRRFVQPLAPQKSGRIIDLRSTERLSRQAADIVQTKRDGNYFQKLIEEKENFPEPPPAPSAEKGKSFLDIDLEDEAEVLLSSDNKKIKRAGKEKNKQGQILSWKKISRSHIVAQDDFGQPREDEGSAGQPESVFIQKPTVPNKDKKSWLAYLSWSFAIVGLLAFLGAMYFVLPKADVALTLRKEKASTLLLAVADEATMAVDVSKGKLPAKILQVEKTESKTFQTTGEKDVQEKAHGKITIYNEYSSSPQDLVATTRFTSSSGKVFRIKDSITVPGAVIENGKISARSIEAEVEADEPGESYNIGPGDFNIPGFKGSPKYDAFYGKSTQAMTGGKTGRAKVIAQEDMQKAETEFSNLESLNLVDEIKKQVPDGYVLLDECIDKQKTEDKTTAKVGDLADSFQLNFTLSIKAIVFPDAAIKELAQNKLNSIKPRADSQLRTESLLVEYQKVEPDFNNDKINFSLSLQGDFIVPVEIGGIKSDLAGKGISQVEDYLKDRFEIQTSEVKLWPIFVRSIPKDSNRINVTVN